VLVVEDNLDTMRSLVLLLRDMGHEAQYAINGYAALEVVKKFHPEYVLLDLGLPGMTGFEVCTRLRAQPGMEKVRIFSITAYGQEDYRQRALSAGCDGHYVKPVSAEQLDKLLRS
jgi:CheY-like chemotaxis protein